MKRKGLVLAISLVLLMVLTNADAEARRCYYNPLVLPFAVAGAVVGAAAAITTAIVPPPPVYPVYPGPYYAAPRVYYGPGPYYPRRAWAPGHYNHYGYWVRGHWR
jgi:multisubunit Na+/H+ antiporter MnhB subunit